MKHHTFSLLSFVVLISLLVSLVSVLRERGEYKKPRHYTYLGQDYPRAWPIASLGRVRQTRENTVHYAFGTSLGEREWNATLPSGGVLVHLGPQQRPFTVSIFHQMRCLAIINRSLEEIFADTSSSPSVPDERLARHCMNYLRQMVLCRANTRLEPVRSYTGHSRTMSEVTHTCNDWSEVYKAAEDNHIAYLRNGVGGR